MSYKMENKGYMKYKLIWLRNLEVQKKGARVWGKNAQAEGSYSYYFPPSCRWGPVWRVNKTNEYVNTQTEQNLWIATLSLRGFISEPRARTQVCILSAPHLSLCSSFPWKTGTRQKWMTLYLCIGGLLWSIILTI